MELEDVVKKIEFMLLEIGEKEISSEELGEMIISQLRKLDEVAYVRFASVYREFSDVSEFIDTLRSLVSETGKNRTNRDKDKKIVDLSAARSKIANREDSSVE